jgi:hypothetical protein
VPDPSRLRIADSDREQLASELRDHMVEGRLTQDEFEERVERAYRASTRAELDALREDLPLSPAVVRSELAQRKAHLQRRLLQEAGGGLTVSAVCVGIWLLGSAHRGAFWPAWIIFFSLLPLARDAWRLLGPAPELDAVERRLESGRRRGGHRHRHHGPPRPPRPPGLPR